MYFESVFLREQDGMEGGKKSNITVFMHFFLFMKIFVCLKKYLQRYNKSERCILIRFQFTCQSQKGFSCSGSSKIKINTS